MTWHTLFKNPSTTEWTRDSKKGDHVRFVFRGVPVTGTVVRIKKDGTHTVKLDDKFEDVFDERLIDWKPKEVQFTNPVEDAWGRKYIRVENLDPPTKDGRHPKYKHLVLFEIEPHHGSYILTAAGHKGDALISEDDARDMFGEDFDDGFGYLPDEYLEILEKRQ